MRPREIALQVVGVRSRGEVMYYEFDELAMNTGGRTDVMGGTVSVERRPVAKTGNSVIYLSSAR